MQWRKEYRRCDHCRAEYRPKRQAQSYCCRECKRAAAYGRERFAAGTQRRRKRRLEASDKVAFVGAVEASGNAPATPLPGSVRNGPFSLIETIPCNGGKSSGLRYLGIPLAQDRRWPHLYRIHWPDGLISPPGNLTRAKDAVRRWVDSERRRSYAEAA
jgi:hypothetical protein